MRERANGGVARNCGSDLRWTGAAQPSFRSCSLSLSKSETALERACPTDGADGFRVHERLLSRSLLCGRLEHALHPGRDMKPIQTKPSVDAVEEEIARLIFHREEPNESLLLPPMTVVARRARASIATAREAVQRLLSVGLVRVVQGRGMITEPLGQSRTLDSIGIEFRAAREPKERRAAILRWTRVMHFIGFESLARSAVSRDSRRPVLLERMEMLSAMLSGNTIDEEGVIDVLREILNLAAQCSEQDALRLGMNSCDREFPQLRPWLLVGVNAQPMGESWDLVARLHKGRNVDGVRTQAAHFLATWLREVCRFAEYDNPELAYLELVQAERRAREEQKRFNETASTSNAEEAPDPQR